MAIAKNNKILADDINGNLELYSSMINSIAYNSLPKKWASVENTHFCTTNGTEGGGTLLYMNTAIYGKGVFLIGGTKGVITYSLDFGQTWNLGNSTSVFTGDIGSQGIAYGEITSINDPSFKIPIFMAVDSNGQVGYSPNGLQWFAVAKSSINDMNSCICFANNKFIAFIGKTYIKAYKLAATSTTLNSDSSYFSEYDITSAATYMVYSSNILGDSTFYGSSTSNRIIAYRNQDKTLVWKNNEDIDDDIETHTAYTWDTWRSCILPSTSILEDLEDLKVVSGKGMLIALPVVSSSASATWTPPLYSNNGCVWYRGKLAFNPVTYNTSYDESILHNASNLLRKFTAITYGNGIFMASTTNREFIYSRDGVNWDFVTTIPLSNSSADDQGNITRFRAGNIRCMAYGSDGIHRAFIACDTNNISSFNYRVYYSYV